MGYCSLINHFIDKKLKILITNTIERQIHFEVIVGALAPNEKEIQ